MKCYKIVFSPTGGTEKAADLLASALGAEVETVDLSAADFGGCSVESDALAVIAAPSFGGRVPKTAIDRLKRVSGSGARAVTVAVYGNRAQEDTLLELSDAAESCGFAVVAGVAAVAEHSIAHQYASSRPDAKDAEQLKGFAEKIAEKLSSDGAAAPKLPGNRPYKKDSTGPVPKTTSACTACGLCAAKCPVGAIDKADPKRVDKSKCISCKRCVSVCPQGAKRVSPLLVKVVGMALKKSCAERKDNELFL